jgi:hypothetical protein
MNRQPKMKLEKLPVWAQNHIKLLYDNLQDLEKQQNVMFDVPADTAQVKLQYFYGATGTDADSQALPAHQKVVFRPDPDKPQYVEVGIDHQRKAVIIHGGGSGLGLLTIEPQTGNVVAVKLRDRQ